MARLNTWSTISVADATDLMPLFDQTDSLDKGITVANLATSLEDKFVNLVASTSLTVATTGLYATSSFVGIGTVTPLAKAHVKSGSSGFAGSLSTNYDELCIEGSSNVGMTILSQNNNNTGIAFADEDSSFQGAVIYEHNSDDLSFWTNTVKRVTIDGNGNIGVGMVPSEVIEVIGDWFTGGTNNTDNANKIFRYGCRHYDIDEEPAVGMYLNTNINTNTLFIGGGTSLGNAATEIRLYTALNNVTTTGTLRFVVDSSGKLATGGETSPDVNPGGICINHGINDGLAMSIKNDDITHPFTGGGLEEADTYCSFQKSINSNGGLKIRGLAGSDTAGMILEGYNAGTTPINAGMFLRVYKSDGATGTSSFADDEKCFSFRNGTLTIMEIFGDGDIYNEGLISTGGEASPDVDSGGFCLNHGANDGNALTIKNSDVNHPFTTHAQSDTYVEMKKRTAASGGFEISGYTSANSRAIALFGHIGSATPSDPVFEIRGWKTDGATGRTALADTESLAWFMNDATVEIRFLGNGSIHTNGLISTGGESNPDVDTGGICINHGSNDGFALSIKNSDISQPFTAVAETDTYGMLQKGNTALGGLLINGLSEGNSKAVQIRAFIGSTSPTVAAIDIGAVKSDGGTSTAVIGDSEKIFTVSNSLAPKLTTFGNGDLHNDGLISTGGESSPDCDAGGICVNHGLNDGIALSIKNTDVIHGFTSVYESDTYAAFEKISSTLGGLSITGIAETDDTNGLKIRGLISATSSILNNATVSIEGAKRLGTNVTDLDDGNNLLVLKNNGTTVIQMYASGEVRADNGGVVTRPESSSVSTPPTDAQIDAIFGDRLSGFLGVLNDSTGGNTYFLFRYSGTWYYVQGTAAV